MANEMNESSTKRVFASIDELVDAVKGGDLAVVGEVQVGRQRLWVETDVTLTAAGGLRIDLGLTVMAGTPLTLPNRWAAFTDDELASLLRWADEAAEWTPEDRQLETTASDQAMLRELLAELERRSSDG